MLKLLTLLGIASFCVFVPVLLWYGYQNGDWIMISVDVAILSLWGLLVVAQVPGDEPVNSEEELALSRMAAGIYPQDPQAVARAAFEEIEKLRREREDLRMFCKGIARNIEGMLK